MRDLAAGPRRFVELQRILPGISTEQLRSRLNRMVADGLLTRQRYREVPPRVDYELTERARGLLAVLGALAQWGYQWIWGPPRPGEAVDIGAIVRLAPGLLSPPRSLSGTLELRVTGKGGKPRSYLLTARRGAVTVQEREAPDADARVGGSQRAWIEAFGPERSRGRLKVEGDRRVADALLDGLTAAAARASAAA